MLTPKNWHEFQHYKDRSPAWIKLHRGLLDDYEFSCLPLASRALAPLLWLLASEYEDGNITASFAALAYRLRMNGDDLEIAIKPLIEHGFFISDSDVLAPRKQIASLEERDKKEDKREIEIRVVASATDTDFHFNEFWKEKPKRKGANPKQQARKSYFKAVKSGISPQIINGAAKAWASECDDKIGTEFVPMAVTWLNQQRFDDYKPPPEAESKERDEFMRSRGYDWIDGKWKKVEAA